MKKCGKCKIIKDLSAFYKNNRYKGGLANRCKLCYREENISKSNKIINQRVPK